MVKASRGLQAPRPRSSQNSLPRARRNSLPRVGTTQSLQLTVADDVCGGSPRPGWVVVTRSEAGCSAGRTPLARHDDGDSGESAWTARALLAAVPISRQQRDRMITVRRTPALSTRSASPDVRFCSEMGADLVQRVLFRASAVDLEPETKMIHESNEVDLATLASRIPIRIGPPAPARRIHLHVG